MKDGSQYVVENERDYIMNWVVSLGTVDEEHNATGCGYSFNRLVDVDNVESVTAKGHAVLNSTLEVGEEIAFDGTVKAVDEDVYINDFDNTYTR